MKCKKCGTEFDEGMFCPECGEKYTPEVESKPGLKQCTNCGAEFTEGDFCPECGTRCVSTSADKKTPKVKAEKKISNNKTEKKKSKLPIIIGAILVVLVALAVLGSVGSGGTGESISDNNMTAVNADNNKGTSDNDMVAANANNKETSQEAVAVSTLSADDPLYGVVSDDILSAFRSETEIGLSHATDDPVFNEAGMLGIWVRYQVETTLPDEVESLGMDIIADYNWLFQLYSSKTVVDNFPNIYAYYYALKHENQTRQGENGETYKLLRDLYNDGGFSQELEQFEEDCRQFITACNNLVRAQRGL